MTNFSSDFLQELRDRLRLSDYVGRRVQLRRNGPEATGLCPFHNEKTPSFTVSDPKGFYHCFGCGAHGSVIDWVMETEGLPFPDAVRRLATDAGLSLPAETPEDRAKTAKRHLGGIVHAVTLRPLPQRMNVPTSLIQSRFGAGSSSSQSIEKQVTVFVLPPTSFSVRW